MKDFLSKIKTLDYKQFALNHGEKIGIGIVGLTVAVVCLFLTSWASDYTGHPRDMESRADEVTVKLRQNKWSDERQKEFPFLRAEDELKKVENPIDLADYEWSVGISPKLYPKQQPAEECDWLAVADPIVRYGQIPMGVEIPPAPSDVAGDEDGKPKPAKSDKPGSRKKDKGDELLLSSPLGGDATGFSGATEKASGRRFNVVLAVVEVRRQQTALMRALRAQSLSEVKDLLNYRAFRLERQRALPGPDPWTGPWKKVNTDSSVEVLREASEYDPDLIAPKYVHVDLTSPLPRRLDGDWDPNLVVHYRIPTLTDEEREYELEQTKIAAEVLKEQGDTEEIEGGGGGFSRIQKDANALRQRARSTSEGAEKMTNYMDRMRSAMPGAAAKAAPKGRGGSAPGPRGATPGRMNMPTMGSAKGNAAARVGPMSMPGMGAAGGPVPGRMGQMPMNMSGMNAAMSGMGGMGGIGGVADMGADVQLFRYFDFDVEPGECYRYRVQLIVDNPSFEQTFVSQPTVAEGKFRETPWSAPSPPAVVERDVEYGLVKIENKKGRIDGAELEVIQFDPNLGSLIMDHFLVYYGAYVGKEKKTLHLDFLTPTFKEEPVTFTSKDVLLDSTGTPAKFSDAVEADLKLDKKKAAKLLDMAVTFNRFGEIVELDAGSLRELESAKKLVEKEREPYEDIKETEKRKKEGKEAGSTLDIKDYASEMGKGKGKKKEKAGNPLKAGSGSMPGMMMAPPTGAGTRGGRGGRGR